MEDSMQVPNIYGDNEVHGYKKPCLGIHYNREVFHCQACDDGTQCRELSKRWTEKSVKRFIFKNGISKPICKVISIKRGEKKTTKEELIAKYRELMEL